jgi:hypothetical protein
MPEPTAEPKDAPWHRRPDELLRFYNRFLVYRDAGPERSVRKACDIAKLPQQGRKPSWQYWRKLAEQWHWGARARAWDAWQAGIRQKEADRLAVDTAINLAEENHREALSRISEARRFAHAAEGGLITAVPVALARLHAAQDEVQRLLREGGSSEKITAAMMDAVAILNWATKTLDLAHKMEREALGKAGSTIDIRYSPAMIDRMTQVIMKHVPEAEWEEVGEELGKVMRGE